TAGDDVMASPTMISPIAVGGECAPKIRNSEERHLAAQSSGHHELIKILEPGAQLAKQGGNTLGLGVVSIKPAQLHKEDLASDPESSAPGNDSGNGLERLGKTVIRQH